MRSARADSLPSPRLGFLGLLLGSFVIGASQLWKTHGILAAGRALARAYQAEGAELGPEMDIERRLVAAAASAAGAAERANAIGVELSARGKRIRGADDPANSSS